MAQVGTVTITDNGGDNYSLMLGGEGRAYNSRGSSVIDIGPTELADMSATLQALATEGLDVAKAAVEGLSKDELIDLRATVDAAIADVKS